MVKQYSFWAAQEQRKDRRAWWWGLQLGVLAALILWWYLKNQPEIEQRKRAIQQDLTPQPQGEIPLPAEPLAGQLEPEPAPQGASTDTIQAQPDASSKQADDLRRIEGIGPKISRTLQQAGILTFEQLAHLTPATIKAILIEGGVRIAYPETWPEQAALAASEDWDALAGLQRTLRGGRRI